MVISSLNESKSISKVPRAAEFIGTKSRTVVANAWGRRGGELEFKGTGLQTGRMKRVLGMTGAMVV